MEYFMVPAPKVPALQHFRKSEKEVIGGLCSVWWSNILEQCSSHPKGDNVSQDLQGLVCFGDKFVAGFSRSREVDDSHHQMGALCHNPTASSFCLANIPLTPETQRDQERRIRREIANSNERRRMQSINAGFQSLKTLIPHTDGEKLSKAAILQQTAEYIFSLEQEKTRLLQQNTQLKRFIQEFSGSSPKRRRAEDKDEGIGSPDIWEDEKAEDLRREMIELRQQLDKERSVRMMLEEQVRSLEAHMYPEKLKVIAQQVQLQQQQEQVRLLHQEKLEREQQIRTQAIQHIEGTQEKQLQEEEQRRAVIVTPARACPEPSASDTASDTEGNDSDSMDQSKEEPSGDGELP
ncbi:hypothetical protein DUI87_05518 [Hirundo rustica rustica]|uniref:BHLH domain-containing protein n=1 Tax=Hirundo rustica rustica TaxID=333673 RepID=A0A3M0KYS7_HIRRU|nr:hypothetical protein DUI87_05518 [Hirundo rustica rustica]